MHFSGDPVVNAIYQGIKRGIQVTFDSKCYGSCLVLIYSGIDTMSYLSMPSGQAEVQRLDFVRWADNYLSPKLSSRTTRITGEEIYSARCGVVHTYGTGSRLTREGKARHIAYGVGGGSITYNPAIDNSLVIIPLETLRDAFFAAIDKFLVESYADVKQRPTVESRLQKLLNTVPYNP